MAHAPTRLVLVRHGQTSANLSKLLSGSTDHHLDDIGERQAQLVARRIAEEIDAQVLFSSPLSRARATAMAISNHTGLEIQEMHDLREVSFGDFEGLPVAHIESEWPEVARQMLDPHNTSLRWPNGDHMLEFYERTRAALGMIATEHAGQTAVVVAHGAVIGGYLRQASGQPINAWRTLSPRNCSISLVDVRNGVPTVIVSNDCTHLDIELPAAEGPE